MFNEKVLTTPDNPAEAVLNGVASILTANGIEPGAVENVIHGTTLVANALIERKGVTTALITTQGFRDVLEIGREWRYDLFDLTIELPSPLVPRARRYEITERVGPDGAMIAPLDEDAVVALARELAGSDVAAVAVVFLHAFRNPAHERRVKEIFADQAPALAVCLSSDVSPEIGEYERSSTTVANAYVQPIFRDYVRDLALGLRGQGIERDLFMMLSDGGTVHESAAIEYPIRLVQSGPAGGAQAAALYGRLTGAADLLCFDMGGTTAKACMIEDGRPQRTTAFEVARVFRFAKGSGLPLQVPVVDMIEIGAGGGSIARLDRMGLIQVGPDSAGAKPGPACYGLGGEFPTVTDADLVLGYLDADNFLGGDMALDIEAARTAIQRHLAEPLDLSVTEAAWGVHETVTENMAQAATIHALEKGRRIDKYTMVPIGGAGPVHACSLAAKMNIGRLICPVGAGVASALGLLASPTAFEFVQADMQALDLLDFAAVRGTLAELDQRGRKLLSASAVDPGRIETGVSALMRYVGQGYEVEVPLTAAIVEAGDRAAIEAAFAEVYRGLFGRTEEMPLEVISWRVVVSGPEPEIALEAAAPGADAATTALKGERPVYFAETGGYVDSPVYDRYALAPGGTVTGPAIVEEREATVVVPPGFTAAVDRFANLIIDRG
jgi:N-methylhydantoinase A